ncbi:MAG: hypothetical protein ACOYMN_24040 [Roseimicrobium sp.]
MTLRAAAVLAVLAAPVVWLVQVASAQAVADKAFPTLTAFSERDAEILWSIEQTYTQDLAALRTGIVPSVVPGNGWMVLNRNAVSGTSAHLDTRGRDWSGFTGIGFTCLLEAEAPVELGVRLDLDEAPDAPMRLGVWLQPGTSDACAKCPSP